jgi:hypothetical protein
MCAPNYFNGAESVRLAEKRKIPSALCAHYRHGFCLPLGQQLRKLQPQTTEACAAAAAARGSQIQPLKLLFTFL